MQRVPPVCSLQHFFPPRLNERLSILERLPLELGSSMQGRKILIQSHNCNSWYVLTWQRKAGNSHSRWCLGAALEPPRPGFQWQILGGRRRPLAVSTLFLPVARMRHIPPQSQYIEGGEASRLLACNTIPPQQTVHQGSFLTTASTTTPHPFPLSFLFSYGTTGESKTDQNWNSCTIIHSTADMMLCVVSLVLQ